MGELRQKRSGKNLNERRQEIMNEIKGDYEKNGKYQVSEAEHKNIILIGRTRTGKSTIKSLLVDPTVVPGDLTLKAGTRNPIFQAFHVRDNKIVLNVIDTPGLFEHSNSEIDIRDNQVILDTIQMCANREITKFHVVCFCISITTGINKEDLESLQLLVKFLGEGISKNSCLIITRCESKDEVQRKTMEQELLEDVYFKNIAPFFQLGIRFSGSLNPDDYNKATDNLYDQFFTISDYRMELIKLFTSGIEPFFLDEMIISGVRRSRDEISMKNEQIEALEAQVADREKVIQDLRSSIANDLHENKKVMDELEATRLREQHSKNIADQLKATRVREEEERVRSLAARTNSSRCNPS